MGYSSVRGYLGTAAMRTLCWGAIVSLVAFCDDQSHIGGMITKCTMHESLRKPLLCWIWVLSIDALVLLMFMCSIHNVYCNQQQQSFISNILAPLTAAFVFAGCGVTMGSVGVWWGFIGAACYVLGPGIIIAVRGKDILTRKFMINMFFRFLHTWDIVTDFATAVILGSIDTTGRIYIALSITNLLMYVGSLYTELGEDSLARIVLNMIKALTLDIPMLALDIYVLMQGDRTSEEQAVIIVSALSSLLESIASIKAALTFREVNKQHARMKETITIAQGIATALAKFDISSAETLLEPDGDAMPQMNAELLEAFKILVSNLKMYRPYLPDAMFQSNRAAPLPLNFRSASIQTRTTTVAYPKRVLPTPLIPPAQQTAQYTTPPTLPPVLEDCDITALVVRHVSCHDTGVPDIMSTQRIVSAFLDTVFVEAAAFNGVLHAFDTGFEVAITFGAVKDDDYPLTNVRSRAHDAYRCAVSLYNKFKQRDRPLVGIGLACGANVVGNFGSEGKLAFCVAGPVIHIARMACEHSIMSRENLVIDPHIRDRLLSSNAPKSGVANPMLTSLWGIESFYTLPTIEEAVDACPTPGVETSQEIPRRASLSSLQIEIEQREETTSMRSLDDDNDDTPQI